MFNVQTINCMQYSEPVVIQTRSQSRNEINTHTEHLVQKHNDFALIEKIYIWSLTKKKENKERRKKS